jgi:RNA polymerase sigma factor (sigma-70 family)
MTHQPSKDPDLLARWDRQRDEAAFQTLVARYAGLVHHAALRTAKDEGLAAEAAQMTFIALARKARGLTGRDSLAGWLHITAVHHARNLSRKRLRDHAKHERLRLHMNPPSQDPATTWTELQPHLDASLAALSEKDRETLLLRFYRSLTVAEIGSTLGIATAAAQKRLDRALQRLRRQLSRRGCATGATLGAVLLAGLGADAKAAMPAVSSIAGKAMAAAGAGGTATLGTLTIIAMTKKTAITTAAALLVVGAGTIIAIQQTKKDSPTAEDSSGAPPRLRDQGQAAGAGDDESSASRIREREAGADADLIERYGESRTNLSKAVTTNVIGLLDDVVEMAEMATSGEMGRAFGGRGALRMGLGRLNDQLELTEEQRDKAVALMEDFQKRELERTKQSVDGLRDNPRTLTSLFLAGDAFARGEIDETEYKRIRDENAGELDGVINPLDRDNYRRQPLGDPDFNAAMTAILDENQAATYQAALEEYNQRQTENPDSSGIDAIPAMELEKLDEAVGSARKMTSGFRQMMEGMGGLRELQPMIDPESQNQNQGGEQR